MDDVHNAEPEESPYIRLPWALVAAGLGGVLLVALGLGLFANRYLRPQLTVLPTPTLIAAAAVAQVVPTPTPGAPPTLPPTPAPTPTGAPIPTVVVLATVAPPTAAALPVNVIPAGTAASAPVPASPAIPTASPDPTVDPALADEVGKAYEKFWRVQSQALLDLDTSHLTEVMDGDYLASVEQRIDSLRAENRAIKIHVILNYSVIAATTESATVFDGLEDDSVYVNIGTEEALTSPAAGQLRMHYELKNVTGSWKVVDSVRYE